MPPGVRVGAPLADLVRERVSCRAFRDQPISLAELATLLRTGYGITGVTDSGPLYIVDRAVPSGGGLYPLEVSVLVRSVDGLPAGIYHYVPLADGLEQVRGEAVPPPLVSYCSWASRGPPRPPSSCVLSAVCERSLSKYGDRGYRYLLLEAGHVAQNLVLAATGLASAPSISAASSTTNCPGCCASTPSTRSCCTAWPSAARRPGNRITPAAPSTGCRAVSPLRSTAGRV